MKYVRTQYPPQWAPIAIIGEAPGRDEDASGKPFVGKSGNLLNRFLGTAGIARPSCIVGNVLRYRPEGNKIEQYLRLGKGAPWESDTYQEHRGHLLEELRQGKPNVIIALGNTPLYALTGKQGIQKWRGSVLSSDVLDGAKVIPALHPSAVLRSASTIDEHLLIHDLKVAEAESGYPEVIHPSLTLRTFPTFPDAAQYLDYCATVGRVAFDIEVMRGEVSCFAVSPCEGDAMCIPLYDHPNRSYFSPREELALWRRLAAILEDPAIEIVMQNAIFDTSFLYDRYGILANNLRDTMIAMGVSHPGWPKGLGMLTSLYTRHPFYKDDGKEEGDHGVKTISDPQAFYEYNARDAAYLHEILPKLEAVIVEQGNWDTYITQTQLIHPLIRMQQRGMRVNTEGVANEKDRVDREIGALEARLLEEYEIEKPNSPSYLCAHFYEKKGERPYINRETKKPRCDEKALKGLKAKGHAEAGELLEYRRLKSLQTRSLSVRLRNGRFVGSYNPVGTKFGRLSSSQTIDGEGGNLQNIDHRFRRHIKPDPGCVLFNVDLAKAENRVVAYIAPDPSMIRAFEQGIDLHSLTASLILTQLMGREVSIEEVDDSAGSAPVGPAGWSQRDLGKRANHGLNYGLSAHGFSHHNEASLEDSRTIVEAYHQAYPGVRRYHRWVEAALRKDRTLVNCYGRRCVFYEKWGPDLLLEANSFIPQSTVGDKIKIDGLLTLEAHSTQFWAIDLLNTVHDSIVFQCPVEAGWPAIAEQVQMLVACLQRPVHWQGVPFTIPADVQMGLSFSKKDMIDLPDLDSDTIQEIWETRL